MKETRLFLLRHGLTDWNQTGLWQGQTDIALNEAGLAQADVVAEHLAEQKFDQIYSSDLGRALRTAEAVAKKQGKEVITTEAWRERMAGVFEGMTSDEIAGKYPEAHKQMMGGVLEPPEGEKFSDFAKRIENELERIVAEHPGEDVLAVSHGGTIRGVTHVALGVPFDKVWSFQVGNTALAQLAYSERGWKLEFWNDTKHLEAANLNTNQTCLTL